MEYGKRTISAVLALLLLLWTMFLLDYQAEVIAERSTGTTSGTATLATESPTPTVDPSHERNATTTAISQDILIYCIPLERDLQEYTFDQCRANGVSYEMVLAIMEQESNYDPTAISATNDYGIMQVNACNLTWLRQERGIDNILDARQGISAGIYILAALAAKYEDPNQILMAYNCARKLWDRGVFSTEYSRMVISRMEALKGDAQ